MSFDIQGPLIPGYGPTFSVAILLSIPILNKAHSFLNFRNARTRGQFKPRNAGKGTSTYQLRQFAEATLGSGSLRKAVKLPDGEDINEWLAVNGKSSNNDTF